MRARRAYQACQDDRLDRAKAIDAERREDHQLAFRWPGQWTADAEGLARACRTDEQERVLGYQGCQDEGLDRAEARDGRRTMVRGQGPISPSAGRGRG
jgi:hypothetical protein